MTCQHKRQEFLGVQDFGPGGPPALDLYNCLDCKTTLSRPHKENDMDKPPQADLDTFFRVLEYAIWKIEKDSPGAFNTLEALRSTNMEMPGDISDI